METDDLKDIKRAKGADILLLTTAQLSLDSLLDKYGLDNYVLTQLCEDIEDVILKS